MPPNLSVVPRPPTWYHEDVASKLVRRLEHIYMDKAPTEKAGDSIKAWIQTLDSSGVFIATLIVCVCLAFCTCGILWGTVRYCRRRNSSKGWQRLQQERDERRLSNNALAAAATPTVAPAGQASWAPWSRPQQAGHARWTSADHGDLYDPPTQMNGLRPLAMSQPGSAPASYHSGPHHGRTMSGSLLPVSGMRHSTPMTFPPPPPRPFSESAQSRSETSASMSTRPLSTPVSQAPTSISYTKAPSAQTIPAPSTTPSRNPSTATTSTFVSSVGDKPPTIDLKRTWTLKRWLPEDEVRKTASGEAVAGGIGGEADVEGQRNEVEPNTIALVTDAPKLV
ncbi:hypothetical protein OIO90_005025 [Microbotryomycetes sp. JL221]|nr:hypothetical protein OIO90_005025 [Microbotryomycetes sp. JL221]